MAREIKTEIKLWNYRDEILAKEGYIKKDKIRKIEFKDAIVDTGSTRLVLPKYVAKKLGLEVVGETWVRYANGKKQKTVS